INRMNEHIQDPQDTTAAAPEETAQDAGGAPAPADALQKERDDLYDRLLRKSAEFDNFRKRVERDRKDMIEWAAADVLTDLLQIADDFDRALAADAPPEAQVYKAGLELIQRQLAELLKKRGVTVVEALGTDFDPHLHQAVAYEEVEGARDGEVVDVMAKGYKLGERLLRPAIVKVAKAS
ncbi:MAG TPA: nucleotide exchange factor GrpE, partial [Vicinamibacterales bacterium]|nr:nucleotide exchange factor GrpE [Vicinamibacterales bacterium]